MAYGGTNEAWIVGTVRTPVGRHGGALSPVRPDDLGAVALEALMERTVVPPSEVEDVYMGCANQAGEDNRDVARIALLLAGFPETVGGTTINRLCGPGLDAVANASRAIMLGEAHAYIRGRGGVHEPGAFCAAQKRARLPNRSHHHLRHHPWLALRQPQDGGFGPHRLLGDDRREPRPGAIRGHPRRERT
jgi:acetyl-CoA acetyltransferase